MRKPTKKIKSHIFIPDMQVKASEDIDYCRWVGEYIARRQPDVIINAGDFADMESLSSYDKGKIGFEGRRYIKDIDQAKRAMDLLIDPIADVGGGYDPRMVFTMGNHEAPRIERVCEFSPELEGLVSADDLGYEEWGWEVYPFLYVAHVDGIAYSHYFVNPDSLMSNALGGTMLNRLSKLGQSFTMGHQQHFLYGERSVLGRTMHGVVAGTCYPYYDEYRGPQSNDNWRGLVVKHNVTGDGQYAIMKVGLDYLKDKFGRKIK